MEAISCATCAQPFGHPDDPAIEKPLLQGRYLECCGRSICVRCLNANKRFETICPYCQISLKPSRLPQGLKDPPAYSSLADLAVPPPPEKEDDLPPYSPDDSYVAMPEKSEQQAPDVLHFIAPGQTIHSLSLAYNVPVQVLRRTNNLFSDNLLQGRKTILIPGSHYQGESLSPKPLESEEEEIKKNKIRRWMMACKVSEYDVALLYLDQSSWDLDAAVEAYLDDEKWEKDHPKHDRPRRKGKSTVGMRRFVGSTA